MIKLTNVSKEYPNRGFALRDVSLHVKKGEFAFLTGHSGSGKSTAMRLVHMSDRPTGGEVRVTGYSSDRVTERDLWKIRRRVGFVFQDFRLLPGRTALENISFVLQCTGTPRKDIVPRTQRLLAQVGLSAKAGAQVHEPVAQGECVVCHSPHGSTAPHLTRVAGKGLCFTCHTEIRNRILRAKTVHAPVDEDDCTVCHASHAAAEPALLLAASSELCTGCHDPSDPLSIEAHHGIPITGSDCGGCHEPHGSASQRLLAPAMHSPFAEGDCEICHE